MIPFLCHSRYEGRFLNIQAGSNLLKKYYDFYGSHTFDSESGTYNLTLDQHLVRKQAYYGAISYVDWQFGRVIDKLK